MTSAPASYKDCGLLNIHAFRLAVTKPVESVLTKWCKARWSVRSSEHRESSCRVPHPLRFLQRVGRTCLNTLSLSSSRAAEGASFVFPALGKPRQGWGTHYGLRYTELETKSATWRAGKGGATWCQVPRRRQRAQLPQKKTQNPPRLGHRISLESSILESEHRAASRRAELSRAARADCLSARGQRTLLLRAKFMKRNILDKILKNKNLPVLLNSCFERF
jgi:hypothetical protein